MGTHPIEEEARMERNLLQEGLWETEGVLPYDAACNACFRNERFWPAS